MPIPRVALCLLLLPSIASAQGGKKLTFDEHVLPVLREKCMGCHSADKSRGGLSVGTYQALMAGGSSGEVVKPGDPDGSRLYLLAAHKAEPSMPPKQPKIADASIEIIRQWIAAGALENAGSKARPVNKPKMDFSLAAASKGKPSGPPPMPGIRVSLEPVVRAPRLTAVTAIGASPWAPLVAVSGQRQVLLYDTDSGDLVGVLPFPEGSIHVLKFSRNGSLLLAGGGRGAKQGRVVVWNVQTGERLFDVGDETDCVLAADISSDQSQIALGGPGKLIRVYSTKDGQLIRETKKHTDWVTAIEFSPDAVLLATGDRAGGLYVWEAHTGREYYTLRNHSAMITDLSWRADSNVLASSSEDTTIRLWEMENGGNIKGWGAHGGGVASVHYAKDGRLVSCGRDRVARIWDQNGAQQRAFEAFPDIALKCAFTHDGQRVISGDWTGQVRVWLSTTGAQQATLETNPASAAERLAVLSQELSQRQAVEPNLAQSLAVSQKAATKAAEELAAMRIAFAATPLGVKAATDGLAGAKANADRLQAELLAANKQLVAKDHFAKAMAEAATKLKAAADAAKDNPELAGAAKRTTDLATQALAELATAQKAVSDRAQAAKVAGEALAKAQQEASTAQAAAAASAKMLEGLTAQANATAAKLAADRAAFEANQRRLAQVRASTDRLRAHIATTKQARQ